MVHLETTGYLGGGAGVGKELLMMKVNRGVIDIDLVLTDRPVTNQ